MAVATIDKEIAEDLCYESAGGEIEGWKVLARNYFGSSRWEEIWHSIITQDGETFWRLEFRLPATENQEFDPFPWGPTLVQVYPKPRMITIYEEKP